jgi:hypothetical protein
MGNVYVVVLDGRQVPFADSRHAELVAKQWDADHAAAVAQMRSEGHTRLADRIIAAVDTWTADRWAAQGPGGMRAVWARMPDRKRVYVRTVAYRMSGEVARDTGMWSCWAWEFERDTYTNKAAVWGTERRPGRSSETEATARGCDKSAVERAFMAAREEALRICERSR